jgi:hypothetical protein
MKKLWYISTYMGGLRKTVINICQNTWLKFMVNAGLLLEMFCTIVFAQYDSIRVSRYGIVY